MRLIHRLPSVMLAALMLFAPLLCVRFCHLRAEVEQRAAMMQAMPDMPGMPNDHMLAQPAAASGHEHHAPLNELKQMVTAVTEFIATPLLLAVAIIVIALAAIQFRFPQRTALDVLTPPPKHGSRIVPSSI